MNAGYFVTPTPTPFPHFVAHNAFEQQEIDMLNQIQNHHFSINQFYYFITAMRIPFLSMGQKMQIYQYFQTLPFPTLNWWSFLILWLFGDLIVFIVLGFIVYGFYKLITFLIRTIARKLSPEEAKVFLEVTFPAQTNKSAYATEQFYVLLHQLSRQQTFLQRLARRKRTYSLELVSTKEDGIRYLLAIPQSDATVIRRNLYSYLPGIKIEETTDYLENNKHDGDRMVSVIELEKLLSGTVGKENYSRLFFENPQMGEYIIIPFSVQEADSLRKKDDSVTSLKKLIEGALEGTNWRLMSDGVTYRLGFLSGRLKGYEREEDFFELSGEKKEEKPSKIDYETRMKYAGHHVIRLAQIAGEQKGIENLRKRRLEKEPEGFFLEASDDFYQCGVCGENRTTSEMWWNLDGTRCKECWRNIKMGIIPSLKHLYDNDDTYFQDWQVESDFGIKSGTRDKLKRQGLLVGRDLKREDGAIYCTVYLAEENQEFLKEYKRKEKPPWLLTDLLGNEVNIRS